MTTQKQVSDYVLAALNYPLRDEYQLISMVVLHFVDLDVVTARQMVDKATKSLRYNPFEIRKR